MATTNPDHWQHLHLRWLALSRWESEGGASPHRSTAGSATRKAAGTTLRNGSPSDPTDRKSIPGR